MNVILSLHDREYVMPLIEAKRLLNSVYKICNEVYINGKKVMVSRIDRDEIKKQLHGQIYA